MERDRFRRWGKITDSVKSLYLSIPYLMQSPWGDALLLCTASQPASIRRMDGIRQAGQNGWHAALQ